MAEMLGTWLDGNVGGINVVTTRPIQLSNFRRLRVGGKEMACDIMF